MKCHVVVTKLFSVFKIQFEVHHRNVLGCRFEMFWKIVLVFSIILHAVGFALKWFFLGFFCGFVLPCLTSRYAR